MSHDAVRRYYTLVDQGKVDELVALFADDAVYERPGYAPLVGADAIRTFYTGVRVIRSGRHVIDALVADGPHVAVRGRFDGILRDGSQAHVRWADFWDFDAAGKVSRRETYFFAPSV